MTNCAHFWASLMAQMVKNKQTKKQTNKQQKKTACNAADLGSVPESGGSPGGQNGNLLQYSCLENPHGQRSLVDYSPWGRK